MTEITILCDQLYDGVNPEFLSKQTITVRDQKIVSVRATISDDLNAESVLNVATVAPGMIDIQINGAADAQFNFDPSESCVETIAWGAHQGGTAYILPTFITAHGQGYLNALNAVRQAKAAGVRGLAGIHLEGPFLSPARPGIHDRSAIRPLSDEDVAILVREAADFPGVILLTLAPECQQKKHLQLLEESGIVLFAGHSEAGSEHLDCIRGATHLWNAMPAPTSRSPGIVSEVLGGDKLYAGIIADGYHVGKQALKLSVRSASDRLCLVTDAMMTMAGQSQGFELDDRWISLADGRLTSADGTLAGAHISMDDSLRKLVELTGIDMITALKMATVNPAKALGLENSLGRIEVGRVASLSLFDDKFSSVGVLCEGHLFPRV